MRVIGYIPLMYGAEYLEACIKSMENHVEKILIVYTEKPSQGHATHIKCHETEEQLKEIAFASSSKIDWHKGEFANEGEHRSYIYKFANGYDLVFTLDADEIVEEEDIKEAFERALESKCRYIGIDGFLNFWKSFNHVCLDGFRPIRIINLKNKEGVDEVKLRIYHFSTAQNIETIKFKWNVSGHKYELKDKWIEHIYQRWSVNNKFTDLHPVSIGLWNAVDFDKTTLPLVLKQHPNYNKEQI